MLVAEGKYMRWHKTTLFAEVAVEVEPHSSTPGVEFRCVGRGFFSQGYVEDVPEVGDDDWKAGATAGVLFALDAAGVSDAQVVVTRISGLETDTNPSAVGAAAAFAVWRALACAPPEDTLKRIEDVVRASRDQPLDHVPNFAEV